MLARNFLFSVLFLSFFSVSAFSAWTDPEPVFEVNSDFEEWSPFLSHDGLTLYFARVRTSESYYGRIFEAIREKPEGNFTNVRRLPGDINSFPGHVFCPWISCDNLRLYYNTQKSDDGWKLKVSERATINDPWPEGTDISELNAIGRYLHMAKLTSDEKIIVFQGNGIPGGQGGHDIWIASRSDRNVPFEYYRNLEEINTSYEEAHPCISSDGLTLYFTSDRNGTEQIFQATRTSLDIPFDNVKHLSIFDTSNGNSAHASVSSDGKTMYFIKRTFEARDAIWDIYVSYYYEEEGYYVDGVNGDDQNDGTSSQSAFATIQKAIDSTPEGYTIFVKPGMYSDPIDFHGKAITLQGMAGSQGVPVLESPDDFAVYFINNEGPETILKNVVIKNSFTGIFAVGSSPTITNVTLVDNIYGIAAYAGANPDITNCIFWNNANEDLMDCEAQYSLTFEEGEGNIYDAPFFVDPNNNDYHLQSERGRYWSDHDVWVLDKVTSPCINTGDPLADFSNEPMPNGGFINMGAYGGTAYASMKEMEFPYADFNRDGIIDESDLSDLIEEWLEISGWLEQ